MRVINKFAYYGRADETYLADNDIQSLDCITPEVAEELESICISVLVAYNAADETATLEGYFIDKKEGCCAVLSTDRETYEILSFRLSRMYDGSYNIVNCDVTWTDPYESFDAVIEDSDPEPDSIIKLNE